MSLGRILAMFSSSGLDIQYLVIAGGGAGGGTLGGSIGKGGGGGAGQLKTGNLTLARGLVLAITVGAGGTGVVNSNGNPGGDSSIGELVTALGGGYGGTPPIPGGDGGNGGGAGNTNGSTALGGSGDHTGGSGNLSHAGGGAGAGGDGLSAGGPGSASSISGSSVTYGIGGPQGGDSGAMGTTPGCGGHGALHDPDDDNAGANGLKGTVIVRYAGSQQATGGTVTTVGSDTVHTFTSSGTFTVL